MNAPPFLLHLAISSFSILLSGSQVISSAFFCAFSSLNLGAVGFLVGFVIGALFAYTFITMASALISIGLRFWHRGNWTRFLAIFAFPYFCSFPIVVVFSTLFILRFLTWQYTALIWLIVFGTCTALWRYGQDKHRKASNPLKGILDVVK